MKYILSISMKTIYDRRNSYYILLTSQTRVYQAHFKIFTKTRLIKWAYIKLCTYIFLATEGFTFGQAKLKMVHCFNVLGIIVGLIDKLPALLQCNLCELHTIIDEMITELFQVLFVFM